jgi:alpha-L-rhamnosidase
MLDILSQRGRTDLAYRIVTQPDFPGWGWMMKNGATTLWEHWEFSDNTFSHNHPMFGSVSQWMLQRLGGIRPAGDAYGFDKVIVEPMTPTGLDWVKSSYQSVRGKIVSNWIRSGSQLTFEVEVPANMQVEFVIPSNLVKGGLLGYKNARIDGAMFRCTLGAGKNIISVGG